MAGVAIGAAVPTAAAGCTVMPGSGTSAALESPAGCEPACQAATPLSVAARARLPQVATRKTTFAPRASRFRMIPPRSPSRQNRRRNAELHRQARPGAKYCFRSGICVRSVTFRTSPNRLRNGLPLGWVAGLALLVACGGGLGPPPDHEARSVGERAALLLGEAIRIDTTNPPGNERVLAEWLAGYLGREGVESRVIPLPAEGSPRAAVWARLPGGGGGRPLILLSHLDVVPADARAWTVDPFAGVVGGGYVVGRGALDAKGVTVTHALALVEAKRRGLALGRDVILLATPDEEAGGRGGAERIVDGREDLLGDAAYVLTEGGGILPGEGGTPDVWGVAFTEKTPCWVTLSARGVPGHGAGAPADAATHRLVAALSRVAALRYETKVVPAVSQMFAALAPLA